MKKVTLILLTLTITLTAGWWRTYGSDVWDRGYSIQITSDEGFIISAGCRGLWLLRTDEWGTPIWSKVYGSLSEWNRNCVQQTEDGGFIAAGSGWGLVRLDENGDSLWSKNIGWSPHWLELTNDKGYIVVGTKIENYGELWGSHMRVLKADSLGNTKWDKGFGYQGADTYHEGFCVQQTIDGGFIISGGHEYNPGFFWLLKTDTEGNTQWEVIDNKLEGGYFVRQTSDFGYVVTGGYNELYLRKIDSLGNIVWTKQYGTIGVNEGYCLQLTEEGGFIVTGSKGLGGRSALWLLKTDSVGDTLWSRIYSVSEDWDQGYCVQMTTDGGYIVCGGTWTYHPDGSDIYLLKTDSLGLLGIEEPVTPSETQPGFEVVTAVGPNIVLRFSPSESRSQGDCVAIFDAAGRQVDELHEPQAGTVSWGDGFSPGVYFIREMRGNSPAQKVVLVK